MEFFDSHAHLDDEKFNLDREEIIKKIKESGVTKFVSAGYSLEGSIKAVELSKKYDFIYATCGISPNDIPQTEEELWKNIYQIKQIVDNNLNRNLNNLKSNNQKENSQQTYNKTGKVVAIGEIGLDYYWEKDVKRRELQKKAFIKQIEIANELELPIVIHTREAVMDTLEILKEKTVIKKGIFHCCPLNRELVKEALKLGFYISFAGPITFKNSKNANEIIGMVPEEKMLIETDSPYLSPEPFRGKRNDPRNVRFMAKKIEEVKNIELEKVAKITYENAKTIFEL